MLPSASRLLTLVILKFIFRHSPESVFCLESALYVPQCSLVLCVPGQENADSEFDKP
jgi:hypothetical protein